MPTDLTYHSNEGSLMDMCVVKSGYTVRSLTFLNTDTTSVAFVVQRFGHTNVPYPVTRQRFVSITLIIPSAKPVYKLNACLRRFTNEKLWYKSNATNTKRKLLSQHLRTQFANKQIVCVEYTGLDSDQEREIFQASK